MASQSKDASALPVSPSPAPAVHEGFARAFWRALTRFDSSKLSPHMALRNSIGVVLPLIAGFVLDMPRGGLVVASGALNVAYSDGSAASIQRAQRISACRVLREVCVMRGAFSVKHTTSAAIMAAVWAFA